MYSPLQWWCTGDVWCRSSYPATFPQCWISQMGHCFLLESFAVQMASQQHIHDNLNIICCIVSARHTVVYSLLSGSILLFLSVTHLWAFMVIFEVSINSLYTCLGVELWMFSSILAFAFTDILMHGAFTIHTLPWAAKPGYAPIPLVFYPSLVCPYSLVSFPAILLSWSLFLYFFIWLRYYLNFHHFAILCFVQKYK